MPETQRSPGRTAGRAERSRPEKAAKKARTVKASSRAAKAKRVPAKGLPGTVKAVERELLSVASLPALEARVVQMGRRTFGPASEEPFRRRPRDAVRFLVGIALLVLLAHHVGDVSPTEQAVFEFFNTLPSGLESFFSTLYDVGALWAVGLVAAAALLARRWRLARDLLLSGGLAWGTARVLGALVVEDQSLRKSLEVITRAGNTPNFPLVRLAIVTAIVAAAAPYVTRPTRRIGGVIVVALALASMYLGTAYPNDALAAIVLGWAVAAAVHLAFGSPGGRPTIPQVQAALAQLGVDARELRLAPEQPAGSTLMYAKDDHGPLWVQVIGRDEADAQLIAKLWRFVAYKDSGPTLFLTRLQQVEHEAYAMLLARSAGVRVARVLVAGTAGPDAAVLVARPLEGRVLSELEPEEVTDRLLKALWGEVGRLHDSRIAHCALNTGHIVVNANGPGIIDFARSATWTPERSDDDVAELLASTAALVGEKRAVNAAVKGMGSEAVAASLPFLQAAALSRGTRELAGKQRKELQDRLERLRELGARATNTAPPELHELYRVKPTNLLMAVGTLVAAIALLGQVGDPSHVWNSVKDAQWGLVAAAFVISMLTNLGSAIALMGCVPVRLPFSTTTEVQVAMSFSNLAIPAVGGTAMQIRFLQKRGISLPAAVAAGGLLSTIANVVVQIGLLAVALWLAPNTVSLAAIPTSSLVDVLLIVALVLGVVAAAVLGIPRLRKVVVPPVKQAALAIWEAVRSPRRMVMIIGGNVVAGLLAGACLYVCLQAYGAPDVSFWTLLAVNIGISTIASLVPVPGGGTAVSSVGLSGALIGLGVPDQVAVAAVLTNQIVVNYLPALPGWLATRHLIKRDYL